MSSENKRIVEKINKAFSDGNTEGFLEMCHEDVVWNMVGEKSTESKSAIREWMSSMEGMEPPKFTVDKMIAEGDSVVCYGGMRMKGEDGIEGDYSYCDVYEFAGGKVKQLQSFVVKHKTEGKSSGSAAA